MIAVAHFADVAGPPAGLGGSDDLDAAAQQALTVLARRPGYLRGAWARSTDDAAWVLLTEWENVGSYRRALGNADVRLHATPLLAAAQELPGAFEILLEVAPGGASVTHASDRTDGAEGPA